MSTVFLGTATVSSRNLHIKGEFPLFLRDSLQFFFSGCAETLIHDSNRIEMSSESTSKRNAPQTTATHRKRRGNTADRILEVATECFAKNGFEGTNLREIADKVGIREPSIYRHYKNKEDLYRQVLSQGLAPVAEALLALTQRKFDPRELVDVPGQMLMLHAENPHVASLVQQAVSMPADRIENELLEQWLDRLLQTGKEALMKAGYESGDEIEISLRILNLFNLVIGYFTNGSLLRRLCGMQPDDPEMLTRQERVLRVTSTAWLLSA